MTNGSGKKKGQLYIDLWDSLVKKYPSLQQIDNPIDMTTGELSKDALRAARYQKSLTSGAAVPQAPASLSTFNQGLGSALNQKRLETSTQPVSIAEALQPGRPVSPSYATPVPIADREPLRQSLKYLGKDGKESWIDMWGDGSFRMTTQQLGPEGKIVDVDKQIRQNRLYVDPEGRVRLRPEGPVPLPPPGVSPSEARSWREDQLIGIQALAVRTWEQDPSSGRYTKHSDRDISKVQKDSFPLRAWEKVSQVPSVINRFLGPEGPVSGISDAFLGGTIYGLKPDPHKALRINPKDWTLDPVRQRLGMYKDIGKSMWPTYWGGEMEPKGPGNPLQWYDYLMHPQLELLLGFAMAGRAASATHKARFAQAKAFNEAFESLPPHIKNIYLPAGRQQKMLPAAPHTVPLPQPVYSSSPPIEIQQVLQGAQAQKALTSRYAGGSPGAMWQSPVSSLAGTTREEALGAAKSSLQRSIIPPTPPPSVGAQPFQLPLASSQQAAIQATGQPYFGGFAPSGFDKSIVGAEELLRRREIAREVGPLGVRLENVREVSDDARTLVDEIIGLYRPQAGLTPAGQPRQLTFKSLPQSIKVRAEKLLALSRERLGNQSPFADAESVVKFIDEANWEEVVRLESYVTPEQNIILDKFVKDFERAKLSGLHIGHRPGQYDFSRWPTVPIFRDRMPVPVYITGPITRMVNVRGNALSRGQLRSVLEARLESFPSTRRQRAFDLEVQGEFVSLTEKSQNELRGSFAKVTSLELTDTGDDIARIATRRTTTAATDPVTGARTVQETLAELNRLNVEAAETQAVIQRADKARGSGKGIKGGVYDPALLEGSAGVPKIMGKMVRGQELTPDELLIWNKYKAHVENPQGATQLVRKQQIDIVEEAAATARAVPDEAAARTVSGLPGSPEEIARQAGILRGFTPSVPLTRPQTYDEHWGAANAAKAATQKTQAEEAFKPVRNAVRGSSLESKFADRSLHSQPTVSNWTESWMPFLISGGRLDFLARLVQGIDAFYKPSSNKSLRNRFVKSVYSVLQKTNPDVSARRNPANAETVKYLIFQTRQEMSHSYRMETIIQTMPVRFASRSDRYSRWPFEGIQFWSRDKRKSGISSKGLIWVEDPVALKSGKAKWVEMHFGDLVASPEKYKASLSDKEYNWIKGVHKYIDELEDNYLAHLPPSPRRDKYLKAKADYKAKEQGEHYWPRVVKNSDGTIEVSSATKTELGRKVPFWTKNRIMESIEQGVEAGEDYEQPLAALNIFARSIQKETRNEILAEQLVAKRWASYDYKLKDLDFKSLEIDQGRLGNWEGAGTINSRYLKGYGVKGREELWVFDEVEEQLGRVFKPSMFDTNGIASFFKTLTGVVKTSQAGLLDVGVSLLHLVLVSGIGSTSRRTGLFGIATLGGKYSGPAHWSVATARGLIAYVEGLGFLPKGTANKFGGGADMQARAERLGNMAFYGEVPIEYYSGVATLASIPKPVGPVLGRLGSAASMAFGSAVDYGRAAMFDSFYNVKFTTHRNRMINPAGSVSESVRKSSEFLKKQGDSRVNKLVEDIFEGKTIRQSIDENSPIKESLRWESPDSRKAILKGIEESLDGEVGDVLRAEMVRIGHRVDGMLGVTDFRAMGMSQLQRDSENIGLLFSQTYTRSMLGQLNVLFASGAMPKETAWIMARSLGGALTAIVGLRFAIEMKKGAPPKEAAELALRSANPRNGREFMSVPVGTQWYGLGGFYRSLVQFIGATSQWDDWDFDEGTWQAARTNPFVPNTFRLWRSRMSPMTSLTTDWLDGETFNGTPFSFLDFFDTEDPGKAFSTWMNTAGPFNMEAVMEGINTGSTAGTLLPVFFWESAGGRSVPYSSTDVWDEMIDNWRHEHPEEAAAKRWDYLTSKQDLSKAELNMIKDDPVNKEFSDLLEKYEEEEERRNARSKDPIFKAKDIDKTYHKAVKAIKKRGEDHASTASTQLGREYPTRWMVDRLKSLAAERNYAKNLIYEEVDWNEPQVAIEAKYKDKQAELDFNVLMYGDIGKEYMHPKIFSEAYERVVGAYQRSLGLEEVARYKVTPIIGDWDWNEYHLRLDALKAMYGDDLIEKTRTAFYSSLPDIEQDRREANDYIRENYDMLSVGEDMQNLVANLISSRFPGSDRQEIKRLYVQYNRSTDSMREAMKRAFPHDYGKTFDNAMAGIGSLGTTLNNFKLQARRNDPKLEDLLLGWGRVDKRIEEHFTRWPTVPHLWGRR